MDSRLVFLRPLGLRLDEARAEMLLKEAQQDVKNRLNYYRQLAAMHYGNGSEPEQQS